MSGAGTYYTAGKEINQNLKARGTGCSLRFQRQRNHAAYIYDTTNHRVTMLAKLHLRELKFQTDFRPRSWYIFYM
jgi:hypothetical protein